MRTLWNKTQIILEEIQKQGGVFTSYDISQTVDIKPNLIGKIIAARLSDYVNVIGFERVGNNVLARKTYRVKV